MSISIKSKRDDMSISIKSKIDNIVNIYLTDRNIILVSIIP